MSGSAAADAERGVNKVRVKRQIRSIVEDLENILGDLKDVAKELKEVVEEIDCLTSDLRLEEDLPDGSRTDTLNSSSSSTTASSVKIYPEETAFRAEELNGDGPSRRCAQSSRERVRFSETVQYHGYCPDCDLQYDLGHTELHIHTLMEPQKPQKTILRKSTSTTV